MPAGSCDREGPGKFAMRNQRGSLSFSKIKGNYGLTDLWRKLNPKTKQFTYHEPAGKNKDQVRSRIDRFYISTHFQHHQNKADIIPLGVSDHYMISATIHLKNSVKNPMGPGYKKMKVQVLDYAPFKEELETLIGELKQMDQSFLNENGEVDHLLTWDIWKAKILECAGRHAKTYQKDLDNEIKILQDKIRANDINENYDPYVRQNLINQLKEKLIILNQNLFIQTHQEQIEKDEKPTAYFYAKLAGIRENNKLNILSYIDPKTNSKVTTTDPDSILEQAFLFYQNLYSEEKPNMDTQNWLLSHITSKRLSGISRDKLEQLLKEKELLEALSQMQNGKSPGIDGIPKEFYLKFWPLIKEKFIKVATHVQLLHKLTNTQQQAVLKLLHKKAEKDNLKNWRPISLLCVDYKIITKTLANRLKHVLDDIISPDQTCGIPSRSIFSNLSLYRNVITHSKQKNIKGFIIALDQEKAFDRVNHDFLFRIMKKFNFGPSFINWIRTLYYNNKSFLLLDGYLSLPIAINRGVRQGCPLSALLYLLVAEVLAEVIRQDEQVKGYPLPGTNFSVKIAQYADDTGLLLIDENSIVQAFYPISRFEEGSDQN